MATNKERLIIELDADTAKYNTKMQSVDKVNKNINSSVSMVGRSAGMAGIQLQQFVGQIQGGQSAMLALSQQSADLGFVLGAPLLGAVVGIGASIAGMLLPSLFKANEEIEKLTENTTSLTKQFSKLTQVQKEAAVAGLQQQLKEQVEKYGELTNEIRDLDNELSNANFLKKQSGGGIISFITGTDDPEEALKSLTASQVAISVLGIELQKTAEQIKALSTNTDNENQITKTIEGLREQADLYGANARVIALATAARDGASPSQIAEISQIFDIIEAKKEEIRIRKEGNKLFGMESEADPEVLAGIIGQESANAQKLEQEQAYIEAVSELRLTGQESAEELLARDVEANRIALENKLINLDQFNKAQEAATKNYTSSKKDEVKTNKKSELEKLNTQQNAIRAGMALNTALFDDNKAVAAGLIVADTATAIVKSLSINPYDYVNVGIIAATGAVNLANALGATKGGGGISSSGGGGGTSSPQQESFTPETSSLSVTEQSEEGVRSFTLVLQDGRSLGEVVMSDIEEATRQGR